MRGAQRTSQTCPVPIQGLQAEQCGIDDHHDLLHAKCYQTTPPVSCTVVFCSAKPALRRLRRPESGSRAWMT